MFQCPKPEVSVQAFPEDPSAQNIVAITTFIPFQALIPITIHKIRIAAPHINNSSQQS